ncbi:MAG: hypothetical protein ABSD56_00155 [Bryobacteraceae bacterium]|jgi:hypothetical protein
MSTPLIETTTAPVARGVGCRYYGKSHTILQAVGRLVGQGGNECALASSSFSPCKREIQHLTVDETRCGIAKLYGRPEYGEVRGSHARR